MTNSVKEMQAFNEIGRIEALDRLEKLLVNGCNSEALEYVKIQQNMELSDLKRHVKSNVKLARMVDEKNPSVAKRITNTIKTKSYAIPTCK